MKRFMSVLLAAILTLSAMSALADVTFKTDYYTLTMPDEWVVDTDNLEADSLDGMDALGYLYAPGELGLAISAYLMRFEDEEGVSLWNAEEAEIQEYADAVVEDYSDDQAVLLDIIKANGVPFVLIRGTDMYGDYLYADTLTDSYAIEFIAYYTDMDGKPYPLTDEAIEQFKSILASFVPAA